MLPQSILQHVKDDGENYDEHEKFYEHVYGYAFLYDDVSYDEALLAFVFFSSNMHK